VTILPEQGLGTLPEEGRRELEGPGGQMDGLSAQKSSRAPESTGHSPDCHRIAARKFLTVFAKTETTMGEAFGKLHAR
jgi:hypothetical protein